MPSYNYCSTLFFHFTSQTDSQRLVKSFSENIFKFLKIQLFTVNVNVKNKSCNYMMDIDKQVKLLNDINKMPLKLRFLRNFIRFLNSNLTNLSTTFLILAYILIFKKDIPFRVYSFKFPYSNTKHSRYSFSTISIKILILFLFNYMVIFFFVVEFNIKKIYFLMHVLIFIIFLMYLNSTKKKKDAIWKWH